MSEPPPITGSVNVTLPNLTVSATVKVYSKPPDDHPIYASIGRVAAEWSHVEHILDVTIWELSGGDRKMMACSTGQMLGTYARYNAIIAILEAIGLSQFIKRAEQNRNTCSKTASLRNRIVHDAWFIATSDVDPKQFRTMPKEDLKFGLTDIPNGHIQTVLEKIRRRYQEALDLRRDLLQTISSRGT